MSLDLIFLILVPFVGLALGLGLAQFTPRRAAVERDDLLAGVRAQRDERIRAARSQALEERAEAEAATRHSLGTLEEVEARLLRREERLENRLDTATAREAVLETREIDVTELAAAVDSAYNEQVEGLERIRNLPVEVGRAMLFERIRPRAREVAAARVESVLSAAEEECRRTRARPSALAVQRSSGDLVGEFSLVPVPIPREEIKGRIIGREGRNIKAFESMTGVELVIDDAPDVVTLSGFDPFRREVARMALLDLVEDGRIHPGRVEESVKRARDLLENRLAEDGVEAVHAAEAGQLPSELAALLGRLSLIRGDGEDALRKSVRRAGIASVFAHELKADLRIVKRAALLMDISRAVGREAGGASHSITADVLVRGGESPAVVGALKPADHAYPAVTPEQAAVILAQAVLDAGLASHEEGPVRRVEAIERAAAMVDDVAEPLAFQVGTRVSVFVRPVEPVDAMGRVLLARSILERIEASLGPRVGMTVSILVPGRRRGQDAGESNGSARFDGGRGSFRGRHGRRGD